MAKCFLTGIELPLKNAYILDQTATHRALRNMKDRVAAMERLLAQFTPKDSVQVYNPKTRKPVTKTQRRLVCQSVAAALAALHPEAKIFIPWPDYVERHAAMARQNQIAPTQVTQEAVPAAPTAPVADAGVAPQTGRNGRIRAKKAALAVGDGHAGAQ